MSKTRDKILSLINFDSTLSNSQIAKALGLSRQLVSYHAKTMRVPRQSPIKLCDFCKKRISKKNKAGLCKEHRYLAFVYEFQCADCGEFSVVEGRDASNRRYTKKRKKEPDKDFCNLRCAKRYMHRQNVVN